MSVPPSVEARAKRDRHAGAERCRSCRTSRCATCSAGRSRWRCSPALSAFLPWELGTKADPFASAPAGIRPEWYFLWMFQALKYVPAHHRSASDGEFVVLGAGQPRRRGALSCCRFSTATRRGRARSIKWAGDGALVFMAAMTALALLGRRRMTAHAVSARRACRG